MFVQRFLCVAFCIYLCTPGGNCVMVRMMSRPVQCPGQVVSAAHRYRTQAVRSVVECAAVCRPDESCVSVVFDVYKRLCHLGNATAQSDCSNMEAAVGNMKYHEVLSSALQCENGGVRSPDGTSCACPAGYLGNNCGSTAADCEEHNEMGFAKGVGWIKPSLAPAPFLVFCDLLVSGLVRTKILIRKDAGIDFNRTMQEYRDGFGDPSSDTFWLGLERLHQLTASKDYMLRVRVTLDLHGNGSSYDYYLYCSRFKVSNETEGYSMAFLDVSPVFNKVGDCLSELRGVPFSAYDADNDGSDSVHCALQHGGGWWFKGDNCSTCNPFGPILSPFDGRRKGVPGESFWTKDLGDIIPFKLMFYLIADP